jgi:hypothetical protein
MNNLEQKFNQIRDKEFNLEQDPKRLKEVLTWEIENAIKELKVSCSDRELAEIIHNSLEERMPEANDTEDDSHDCSLEVGHGEDGCSHASHSDKEDFRINESDNI